VARAILREADDRQLETHSENVSQFINQAGFGVSAMVSGRRIVLGTDDWLEQNQVQRLALLKEEARKLEKQGITCVHVAIDGVECGTIAIADRLRADAKQLIGEMRAAGIELTLLSGDRRRVAEAIAEELGGMNVIAEVLPEQKDQVIQELQSKGEQIAMVGDGINDAPALTRADVGIAVGSGTDVSMESADIVLISDELNQVHLASELSRRTLKTIRQNIAISICYNVIMVPLAMMAYITPLVAAVSMPISSLAVIGNAARIRTLFRGK
jgi:Cu2+-exporting ATPase